MDRAVVAFAALLLLFLGGVGAYFVAQGQSSPQIYLFDDEDRVEIAAERAAEQAMMDAARDASAPADAPGSLDTGEEPPADAAEPEPAAEPPAAGEADPRPPSIAGKRPSPGRKRAVDVEKALDTKVTVAASNKTLTEVAEMIGEAAGLAVNVDYEGADKIPLTLQLEDVTARIALKTLAMIAGLEMTIEDDHVALRPK